MDRADVGLTELRWIRRSHYDVMMELESHCRPGCIPIVGIDGRSGSGKTTLAAALAGLNERIAVVHTDDLAWHHSFFGWADLLIEQILAPLRRGRRGISYRPPGWVARNRSGSVTVPADVDMVVVEGVGACRREIRPLLDASVWVHIECRRGRRRVLDRRVDSDEFVQAWMSAEETFLTEHRPWEYADIIVAGDLGQPSPRGTYGDVVTATLGSRGTRDENIP